jgi:hypothetical protein
VKSPVGIADDAPTLFCSCRMNRVSVMISVWTSGLASIVKCDGLVERGGDWGRRGDDDTLQVSCTPVPKV